MLYFPTSRAGEVDSTPKTSQMLGIAKQKKTIEVCFFILSSLPRNNFQII